MGRLDRFRSVRRAWSRRRGSYERSLGRVAIAVGLSAILHAAALDAALRAWDLAPGAAPATVLVELAEPARPSAGRFDPADDLAVDTGAVSLAEVMRLLAGLTGENADLSARLEAEGQQAARAEARHRQELAALETARSRLGEQVAALSADRETLSSEVAVARARALALEQELAARREAEARALAEMHAAHDRIVSALRREIAAKEVALEQSEKRLTVAIVDRVLFPSGQATLTPEGERVIDKVGTALRTVVDQRVLIEGHTDDVPIGPELQERFPTNWELSTARATEVVKRFIDTGQIARERLRAVGRADTAPVASNDTETGRRQNRRIEIILLPPDSDAPPPS